MHRYHTAKIPDVFIDYVKRIQNIHHYAARNCSGLYAMHVKIDLGTTGNPGTSECVFSKFLKTCIKTNLF